MNLLKCVLQAFRPASLVQQVVVFLMELLLAHPPQLRHVHREVVNPPVLAAICVRLARIKTEVV